MKRIIELFVKFFKLDTTGDPVTVARRITWKFGRIIACFIVLPMVMSFWVFPLIQSDEVELLFDRFGILIYASGGIMVSVFMIINDSVFYLPQEPKLIFGTIRATIRYIFPAIGILSFGYLFISTTIDIIRSLA